MHISSNGGPAAAPQNTAPADVASDQQAAEATPDFVSNSLNALGSGIGSVVTGVTHAVGSTVSTLGAVFDPAPVEVSGVTKTSATAMTFDFPRLHEGQKLKIDKGSEVPAMGRQWSIKGSTKVQTLTPTKMELDVSGKMFGLSDHKRLSFERNADNTVSFVTTDIDSRGKVEKPSDGSKPKVITLGVGEQKQGSLVLTASDGTPTTITSLPNGGINLSYRDGGETYTLVLTP